MDVYCQRSESATLKGRFPLSPNRFMLMLIKFKCFRLEHASMKPLWCSLKSYFIGSHINVIIAWAYF